MESEFKVVEENTNYVELTTKPTWKQRVIQAKDKTFDWCKAHKEGLMIAAPLFGEAIIGIVKEIRKTKRQKMERHLKEDYIYDRSYGHYYELKRQPKSSEWIEIERRKHNGESLGYILQDMRLVK